MHPDQPERDKLCIPIRKFHAERIADIARRLDAVKATARCWTTR
jgi:hypothetical protein